MRLDKRNLDRGYLFERTAHSNYERIFADAWQDRAHQLADIIGYRPKARDRFVAASVVQWLGTNVGWAFMQTCLGRCGGVITGPLISDSNFNPEQDLVTAIKNAQKAADANQLLFDLSEPT